jgi:hypothetical protein
VKIINTHITVSINFIVAICCRTFEARHLGIHST